MVEQRRAPRYHESSPITFRLDGQEASGELVNLSGTGALFRCSAALPIGPGVVGHRVTFTSWYDVGALLRPEGTVVRYFEEPEGKHLAIRYLPD
jgi:hypothetical protein